jgi:secondary thiamine-phosphate synthase enzyme
MVVQITSKKPKEVIDITDQINSLLQKQQITQGVCILFVKHTTACLTTADLDPGTDLDMLDAFEAMMPKLKYRHPHNPGHVTDHILSSLVGPSLTIPIHNGELDLGTWQRVVLIELDGPREREIIMSLIKN